MKMAQLTLPGLEAAIIAVEPFAIVDRPDYNLTAAVLEPFREGGKRGLAVLRLAEYGFLSTEVVRRRMGLPDLGVPNVMLLGMTEAEGIALYAGIGRFKRGKLQHESFAVKPVEGCVSELVKDSFSFMPRIFREIAKKNVVDGYDTTPGGLINRMQYLLSQDPSLGEEFRASALSTFRILDEDRRHIWQSGFDDLVDDLTNLFKAKFQRAASQPINNPAYSLAHGQY